MSTTPLPLAAFVAGLISFLSPCVLPLVPGYVSLISGASLDNTQTPEQRLLGRVMANSLMFILGFSIVFIALGAAATGIGQLTHQYYRYLTRIAGVIIIIFGLHLTGIWKIKAFYADKRMHSVKGSSSPWGSFLVGFAFAFGWTPCIGPILATILTFAASEDSVYKRRPAAGRLLRGTRRSVPADLAWHRSLSGVLQSLPSSSAYRRSRQRSSFDRRRSACAHASLDHSVGLSIVLESLFVVGVFW